MATGPLACVINSAACCANCKPAKQFADLTKILFKVQPAYTPNAAAGPTLQLSPAAARSIEETAAAIDDPKLRAALERLASRVKKTD